MSTLNGALVSIILTAAHIELLSFRSPALIGFRGLGSQGFRALGFRV